MEITVDNRKLDLNLVKLGSSGVFQVVQPRYQKEINTHLVNYIKSIVLDNELTIEKLGHLLNKNTKTSNINISRNGKSRKINTFIKEYYGGLLQFIKQNYVYFSLKDNLITTVNDDEYIFV